LKVLILGGDTPLGLALIRILEQQHRHEFETIAVADTRFKSERVAKKTIKRLSPQCLIDLRLDALLETRDTLSDGDIQRTRWFGKACLRNNIFYLFQSSAWVFSGRMDGAPWVESEEPDDESNLGRVRRAAEQAVKDMTGNAIILRLAPTYSAQGEGVLVKMLQRFGRGERMALSDAQYFNPISADDGARVIAAILDQIASGSNNRGIFHYGSNERASYYEFGEAVFAAASQFANIESGGVARSSDASQPQGDWTLGTQKIFDSFGIHSTSWRRLLAPAVKAFYQHQKVSKNYE
jgi:dTDP-4-dehydrorhamnose reductase